MRIPAAAGGKRIATRMRRTVKQQTRSVSSGTLDVIEYVGPSMLPLRSVHIARMGTEIGEGRVASNRSLERLRDQVFLLNPDGFHTWS